MAAPASAVVLGMGNLILSDDGVGIHALRALGSDARLPPNVKLVDGGTFGTELVGFTTEAKRLILLDAVDVGSEPGAVVRLEGDALYDLPAAGSVHGLGAAEFLSALRLLGEEPEEIILLGVQPESIAPGVTLSPCVDAAVSHLVDAALAILAGR